MNNKIRSPKSIRNKIRQAQIILFKLNIFCSLGIFNFCKFRTTWIIIIIHYQAH